MNNHAATHRHDYKNLDFQRTILDAHLKGVTRACRDSHSHGLARDLVPLGELLQDNVNILEDEHNFKDNLLPIIVEWFSAQFFSWFQPPSCEKCSVSLGYRGSSVNKESKMVEHYACDKDNCDFRFDFIRHNEPAILLHTRTGRCGEWGLCFFVILRSLDYDARIVYDTTDHVWIEVWSDSNGRWMHVDPCESVVDTPLLYEVGWSKKLEYCIAFGQYEVVDVTRRYVISFNETKKKRNACDESWLSIRLDQMTEDLLKLAPTAEIRDRVRQKRCEDIKFLNSALLSSRRIPDKSELAGRKTGSVQWRIARGEYKPSDFCKFIVKVGLNTEKTKSKEDGPLFGLYYYSDGNIYKSTSEEYNNLKNWSMMTYEYQNLDFKYERDWKMSYLARYETCPYDKNGLIKWRYDVSNLRGWNSLKVFILSEIYPSTGVRLSLETRLSDHTEDPLETMNLLPNTVNVIERQHLNENTNYIDLVAVLEGGDEHDEVAWQKPQLFRQPRDCSPDRPSAMSVEFF